MTKRIVIFFVLVLGTVTLVEAWSMRPKTPQQAVRSAGTDAASSSEASVSPMDKAIRQTGGDYRKLSPHGKTMLNQMTGGQGRKVFEYWAKKDGVVFATPAQPAVVSAAANGARVKRHANDGAKP